VVFPGRSASHCVPGGFSGDVNRLETVPDGRTEYRENLRLPVADVKRGMDGVRRNEGRVAGPEKLLGLFDPLLNEPRDDKDHLFLSRMLVKVVPLFR
jgi:hypothetical protein